ncbi:ribulose-phosphate 3-epimerase [Aquiluna sp. Uisw_065]|mgnify:FL=1|jgi:ribulose-phosphate 3-epimerase|uniref:ribulose-phosphate 3-epimerase n=1 Tax=Aquiluna sp. Uisw_065 TaxID=3230967 RepID=UPI00359137E2
MQINPSILSADFANLEAELMSIASADMAHVDVMDNHFVPNLTLGTAIVERLAKVSPIPLDVHLMIEHPDKWAIGYAQAGASSVTFHLEAATEPIDLARRLRAAGVKAAVAIKPATKVSDIAHLIQEVDMLLVMTVEPGFGGQPILVETLEKIAQARQLIEGSGARVALQVDGGVTESNIAQLASLGADSFVAGSAIYNSPDRANQILRLRGLALAASNPK